jgi:hypothetical protein
MQSYLDRSYYTNEKTAELVCKVNIDKISPNLIARLVLQAQGKKLLEKNVRVPGTNFSIPVPISSLPVGECTATISLMLRADTIYAGNVTLVKYPGIDYSVKMDKKNLCMLVNDKPFFPIGITAIPDQAIPEYAEAGFNVTLYCSPDIAYYNGFMSVLSTYYTVTREDYKALSQDALEKKIREKGSLQRASQKYGSHPSFIGYFWDEPAQNEVRGVEVLSNLTRQFDPYHAIMPCFYNNDGPTIPSALYDISIADLYWYGAPLSKTFIRHSTLYRYAQICENETRKPLWFMPEAAGWDAKSAITPAEQRVQTYLGLIYGARGIFYWTYDITYPAMRIELKRLGRELRELTPVLLTRSPEQTATGVEATEVHALAKIYNGDCYLLTANNSADEEKTMRIKVSAPSGVKVAKVLFENRTIPVNGGVLEDKFAPYATHVYVLERADIKKPVQIAVEKLSSLNIPQPEIRRWPDWEDTLYAKVGNPGFEDAEDGQPRQWKASCGWEVPEYCALSATEFHEGAKSLKLSIPQPARYVPETGFGWSAESNVTAFDLGKLRPACRYGHKVVNGLFKVDLPNGTYSVKVLSSTSELFGMKGNTRQPLGVKTVEIPVPKGIENTIKENTFNVTVEGGQFNLFIPSGSIYSLTITPQSGKNVQAFDFGTNAAPVAAGHKLVSASQLAMVFAISANGDSLPRIKFKDNRYTLSVYMKSDTPDLPVNFGMRVGTPSGSPESKTVRVGSSWARYEMPITKKGEWVYVQLGAPGTVWVDDFAIEEN